MNTASNTISRARQVRPEGRVDERTAPRLGYGACYVSGCRCNSFSVSSSTCMSCGHSFSDHG